MSTKIYDAYRVRPGFPLWSILFTIKREGQAAARARLAAAYRDILDGRAQALADWYKAVDAEIAASADRPGDRLLKASDILLGEHTPAAGPRPRAALAVTTEQILADLEAVEGAALGPVGVGMWVRQKYGAQLASRARSTWNLDVSVSVRELDGACYLIPHCDRVSLVGGSLDFLAEFTGLEAYGYWNNADKPDDVSDHEWDQRRDVWGRMLDRWSEYVSLDIVTFGSFHEVSPAAEMRFP